MLFSILASGVTSIHTSVSPSVVACYVHLLRSHHPWQCSSWVAFSLHTFFEAIMCGALIGAVTLDPTPVLRPVFHALRSLHYTSDGGFQGSQDLLGPPLVQGESFLHIPVWIRGQGKGA